MVIGPAMRRKTIVFHRFVQGPQTCQSMSWALVVGYKVTTLSDIGYEGTTHDFEMFLRITFNLDYGMF